MADWCDDSLLLQLVKLLPNGIFDYKCYRVWVEESCSDIRLNMESGSLRLNMSYFFSKQVLVMLQQCV